MRRWYIALLSALLIGAASSAAAATGKVVKVLPHFLDQQGRHALSPSLYERDAYQAQLRRDPEQRSGLRFDVLTRVRTPGIRNLRLKVEVRGVAEGNLPSERTVESAMKGGSGSRWTTITLSREDYAALGEMTAWRVTLWAGDELLGEQKSFLW
jgi:hypothetical protein